MAYLPPLEQCVQFFFAAELQAVTLRARTAMATTAMMDFMVFCGLFLGLRRAGITRSCAPLPVLVDKVLPLEKHALASLHFLCGGGSRG